MAEVNRIDRVHQSNGPGDLQKVHNPRMRFNGVCRVCAPRRMRSGGMNRSMSGKAVEGKDSSTPNIKANPVALQRPPHSVIGTLVVRKPSFKPAPLPPGTARSLDGFLARKYPELAKVMIGKFLDEEDP